MTTRRVNGAKRSPTAHRAADRVNSEKRRPTARRAANPNRRRDTSALMPNIRPTTKRILRALGGRRLVLEGFGPRAPTHLAIVAGGAPPIGAWISPRELRSFIEAARKILR